MLHPLPLLSQVVLSLWVPGCRELAGRGFMRCPGSQRPRKCSHYRCSCLGLAPGVVSPLAGAWLPPSGPFCLAQVTPARLTMHLQLLVLAATSGHVAALTGVCSLLGRLGWSQVQQPPHRRHLSEAGPLPRHRLTWMQQEKAPASRSSPPECLSPHHPSQLWQEEAVPVLDGCPHPRAQRRWRWVGLQP